MYCACGSAHNGAEAESEHSCAYCIPQFHSHPRIWVAWSVVCISSQGNFGGISSLGPFVIYVLSIHSWNGIFFNKWIKELAVCTIDDAPGVFWC